jgi:hypothetical protein
MFLDSADPDLISLLKHETLKASTRCYTHRIMICFYSELLDYSVMSRDSRQWRIVSIHHCGEALPCERSKFSFPRKAQARGKAGERVWQNKASSRGDLRGFVPCARTRPLEFVSPSAETATAPVSRRGRAFIYPFLAACSRASSPRIRARATSSQLGEAVKFSLWVSRYLLVAWSSSLMRREIPRSRPIRWSRQVQRRSSSFSFSSLEISVDSPEVTKVLLILSHVFLSP